jgi:hypothetical protein
MAAAPPPRLRHHGWHGGFRRCRPGWLVGHRGCWLVGQPHGGFGRDRHSSLALPGAAAGPEFTTELVSGTHRWCTAASYTASAFNPNTLSREGIEPEFATTPRRAPPSAERTVATE